MAKDEVIIGCYERHQLTKVIDGAEERPCHDCRKPVMMAPSTRAAVDSGAIGICMDCMKQRIDGTDEPVIFGGFFKGQAQEIAHEVLKRNAN